MIKHVNITFVFQKEYRGSEENCHLLNILPVISKIFEKLLYKQMTPFFYQFLSMFQRSFYKRANAQRCFLPLYRSGRQQLTIIIQPMENKTAKVNCSYSCLRNILFRVPQRSNLELLCLLDIFLSGLVVIFQDFDVFIYADENALHDSGDIVEVFILSIKIFQENVFCDLWIIGLKVTLASAIS